MAVTQPQNLRMAVPQYDVDKIIGIFTGSFSTPAPGLFVGYNEQTFNTDFNDTCLTRCLYQVDGGDKNDDNFPYPIGSNRFGVQATSFSRNNTAGVGAFNSDFSGAIPHTVNFQLYCYAKSDQGKVNPIKTDQPLAYASRYNYEKIYIDEVQPMTVTTGSPQTFSVLHDLGYVPDTKTSIEYVSTTGGGGVVEDTGTIYPAGLLANTEVNTTGSSLEHNGIKCSVEINTTSVTYRLSGTITGMTYTVNIHYRIYLND